VVDEAWAMRAGDDATVMGKVLAASAICLWIGVLYYGRMLPFIGDAF
jgi:hypothetical protein